MGHGSRVMGHVSWVKGHGPGVIGHGLYIGHGLCGLWDMRAMGYEGYGI